MKDYKKMYEYEKEKTDLLVGQLKTRIDGMCILATERNNLKERLDLWKEVIINLKKKIELVRNNKEYSPAYIEGVTFGVEYATKSMEEII